MRVLNKLMIGKKTVGMHTMLEVVSEAWLHSIIPWLLTMIKFPDFSRVSLTTELMSWLFQGFQGLHEHSSPWYCKRLILVFNCRLYTCFATGLGAMFFPEKYGNWGIILNFVCNIKRIELINLFFPRRFSDYRENRS